VPTKLQEERTISKSESHKAVIRVCINEPRTGSSIIARSVHSALSPEILSLNKSESETRITSSINNTNNSEIYSISLQIETQSIPNLRASINSYLHLLETSIMVIEHIQGYE
jgi:tRNA threonylcarbamoyladenosine modification (KEOPS) complex  Pcc1 subunit